tara:strand:- start:579 stop:1190 length:612 start_codon:yes stop_codon:yes gene_type:complete
MNYKKYQEGGSTSGPVMTASLARTLAEIEANQDLRLIKDAEKKISNALMDEVDVAEGFGQNEDTISTILRNVGGWGGALAAKKWGGDKYSKYAPIAGSLGDMLGGVIGQAVSPKYTELTTQELIDKYGIDMPATKWHRGFAQELLETGESGLSDIGDKAKKSSKDLSTENLLRGLMAAPTYGEVVGGEDWLTNLFGIGTDTEN